MSGIEQLGYDALRQRLQWGSRPNKYLLKMTTAPGISVNNDEVIAFCKGASVPSREMGVAEVWIQGRKIPIPGDAQFAGTWDLTFYNDQNHNLRKQFEQWIEFMDSYSEHRREFSGTSYWADKMTISQLDAQNQLVENATWEFYHVFPSAISAVDFGADSNDTVSEFTLTLTYSNYKRIL